MRPRFNQFQGLILNGLWIIQAEFPSRKWGTRTIRDWKVPLITQLFMRFLYFQYFWSPACSAQAILRKTLLLLLLMLLVLFLLFNFCQICLFSTGFCSRKIFLCLYKLELTWLKGDVHFLLFEPFLDCFLHFLSYIYEI